MGKNQITPLYIKATLFLGFCLLKTLLNDKRLNFKEHHVLLSIDPVATCGEAAALIGVHQQALCDVEYSFSTAKSISDGQDVLDEVWLRAPRS